MKSSFKGLLKHIFPIWFLRMINTNLKRIRYFGWNGYCPVCRSRLHNWKPLGYDLPVIREKQIVGSGYRKALCPVCYSSDRIRLLYLFLKSRTGIFKEPLSLLHIAPNDSIKKKLEENKQLDYLTADIDQEKVMEQMDITRINYPEGSFDVIICNHVLEHIPDDKTAMKELYRVLKPGGWAILQVPFSKILDETFEDPSITNPEDRERIFGQTDHVRIYGLDYPIKLQNAGFKLELYRWTEDNDLKNPKNLYGLNPDEIIFFARK
jgi:SAM-dependent methyltransferase